jgi:hypothetical protein
MRTPPDVVVKYVMCTILNKCHGDDSIEYLEIQINRIELKKGLTDSGYLKRNPPNRRIDP